MKNYILGLLLLVSTVVHCKNNTVDILIYSYNRPLQLYALLESIYENMIGYNDIYIIYRADSQAFEDGYIVTKNDFSDCIFIKQSEEPKKDFKQKTVEVFEMDPSYILFAVDDIIVKDFVDLQECVQTLHITDAYGFFLRLGTNVTYCYSMSGYQGIPPLSLIENDSYTWSFKDGRYDWRYPFSLDMTLYPKENIQDIIVGISYQSPNVLEAIGSGRVRDIIATQVGVCFESSKIVNIPLNIVQKDCPGNNNLRRFTVDHLLELFNQGYKIDITRLKGVNNKSAHADIELAFVKRTRSLW